MMFRKRKELFLKDYYIVYFDILGYKDMIKKYSNQMFLHQIYLIIEKINKNFLKSGNRKMRLIIKNFSDNFLIALPVDYFSTCESNYNLGYLISLVSWTQIELLEQFGVLIRGSVTKGELFINDKFVFGSGLIKAVELEQQAIYPRIVVDRETMNIKMMEESILMDNNLLFINYLDNLQYTIDNDNEYAMDIIDNINDKIKENVEKFITIHAKDEWEKILAKYDWLIEYHNKFYAKNNLNLLCIANYN